MPARIDIYGKNWLESNKVFEDLVRLYSSWYFGVLF